MDKPRHRIASTNPMKRYIADPGPMGLFAFAVITFVAATTHMGWMTHDISGAFSPAILYGGLVQVIAGLLDLLRGEKVTGSTFLAFGFYWASQGLWQYPGVKQILEASYEGREDELRILRGWYVLAWGLVAFASFLATLRTSVVQIFLLGLVTFDFTALGILNLAPDDTFEKVIGYVLLVTALVAYYVGVALLCKDKSPVSLPLWPVGPTEDEEDWANPGLKKLREAQGESLTITQAQEQV